MQNHVVPRMLSLIVCILLCCSMAPMNTATLSTETTYNVLSEDSENHPLLEPSSISDLIEIDYMAINGDDELLQMAEDNDWPGSGFEWDPIIIQGYYFRNAVHMFVVDDTELYWEFSNNVLDGIDDRYCEIVIGNLRNGKISNNYFTRGAVGIHSIRVHDCQFTSNVFYNQSWDGILLEYSYNNIIKDNEFIDEGEGGILAWVDSYGNNIMYNEVHGSPYGFLFWDGSYGNIVQHNSINDISFKGLDIQTENNIIQENEIFDIEGDAVSVSESGTQIRNNLIYNNGGFGINIYSLGGNAVIENNVVINCEGGGVTLHSSDNSLIQKNDFYDSNEFQAWDFGDNNIFTNNYWHEWIGNDTDDNGIIDVPKHVNGGDNTDPRPSASPVNPIPSWYDFEPITGPPPEPTEMITEPTSTTENEHPTTSDTATTVSTNNNGVFMSVIIVAGTIVVVSAISIIIRRRG